MSTKSIYINQLINAKVAVTGANKDQDPDYLTYITSNAIVVGKKLSVNPLVFESPDKIEEALDHRLSEKIPVSVMDIAAGLYNFKTAEEKNDVANDIPSIALEDVQVLTSQNTILNLSHFVLFIDQIVGVVPTKVDLINLQQLKG